MTRFILVRHGETLANREFRYIGTRDDLLSDRGEEQAQLLAQALAVLPVQAVYSSPLKRAAKTAEPIAALHNLPVTILSDLRECSFGTWEGMSRAEVLASGSAAVKQLRAWERSPAAAPPNGESFEAVQARVISAVAHLVEQHPDQTIVLVSHVGPIKVLLCSALDAPLTSLSRVFLDPASVSVVDWAGSRQVVRLCNGQVHLGWDQARWLAHR